MSKTTQSKDQTICELSMAFMSILEAIDDRSLYSSLNLNSIQESDIQKGILRLDKLKLIAKCKNIIGETEYQFLWGNLKEADNV